MKSLAELQAIRDRVKNDVEKRGELQGRKVVVGMATCGIAAGARPVMSCLLEEVQKHNLTNVTVTQTGCIGVCRLEPIVEVFEPNGEKVTYVKMNPERTSQVVQSHLIDGKVITQFTIGYEENQKA